MIPTDPLFHKPKSIIAAKNLLYTSMFLAVINYFIGNYTSGLFANSLMEAKIITVITLFVIFASTRRIGLGQKWARIAYLVFFILWMIVYCYVVVPVFRANILLGVFSLLQAILQVMAVGFLFSRASTEWFNKVGVGPKSNN